MVINADIKFFEFQSRSFRDIFREEKMLSPINHSTPSVFFRFGMFRGIKCLYFHKWINGRSKNFAFLREITFFQKKKIFLRCFLVLGGKTSSFFDINLKI